MITAASHIHSDSPTRTVVVLAGGLGTRLREVVADVPKPMAPVAGRPFLEYLLDRVADAGFRTAILSVGYMAEVVRGHFGERYRCLDLRYAVEATPLGTGGAIRAALRLCEEASSLVLNGDTFLALDPAAFTRFHTAHGGGISMAVRHVEDASRYGTVVVDNGRIVRFGEKSHRGEGVVNSGAYVIDTALAVQFPTSDPFSLETDFLVPHSAELRPWAFVTGAYMIDIGIPDDFHRAQIELPQRIRDA